MEKDIIINNYDMMDCLGNWTKIHKTKYVLKSPEKQSYYQDSEFKENIKDWLEVYQDLKYDDSRAYRFFLVMYEDDSEMFIRTSYNNDYTNKGDYKDEKKRS